MQRRFTFHIEERLKTLERLVAEAFDASQIGASSKRPVLLAPHDDPLLASLAIALGVIDTAARYLNPDWGGFVIYALLIVVMIRRGNPLGNPQQGALIRQGSSLKTRRLR